MESLHFLLGFFSNTFTFMRVSQSILNQECEFIHWFWCSSYLSTNLCIIQHLIKYAEVTSYECLQKTYLCRLSRQRLNWFHFLQMIVHAVTHTMHHHSFCRCINNSPFPFSPSPSLCFDSQYTHGNMESKTGKSAAAFLAALIQ